MFLRPPPAAGLAKPPEAPRAGGAPRNEPSHFSLGSKTSKRAAGPRSSARRTRSEGHHRQVLPRAPVVLLGPGAIGQPAAPVVAQAPRGLRASPPPAVVFNLDSARWIEGALLEKADGHHVLGLSARQGRPQRATSADVVTRGEAVSSSSRHSLMAACSRRSLSGSERFRVQSRYRASMRAVRRRNSAETASVSSLTSSARTSSGPRGRHPGARTAAGRSRPWRS